MEQTGTVREWHDDEGWGVVDGPGVPGGCWVSFSAIAGEGFRRLRAGDHVRFVAEEGWQDGFAFRATRVGDGPLPSPTAGGAAYGSSLVLTFDDPGRPPLINPTAEELERLRASDQD